VRGRRRGSSEAGEKRKEQIGGPKIRKAGIERLQDISEERGTKALIYRMGSRS